MRATRRCGLSVIHKRCGTISGSKGSLFRHPLVGSGGGFSKGLLAPKLFCAGVVYIRGFLMLSLVEGGTVKSLHLGQRHLCLRSVRFLTRLLYDSLQYVFVPLEFCTCEGRDRSTSGAPGVGGVISSDSVSSSFSRYVLGASSRVLEGTFECCDVVECC